MQKIKVTIWNEFRHEKNDPAVRTLYPRGMHRAIADGIETFIDSASLMDHYGHSLHTVHGPANNIKITTPTDYYLFKALVDAKENADIFS